MITAALTLLHCPCVFLFVALSSIFLVAESSEFPDILTSGLGGRPPVMRCNYSLNLFLCIRSPLVSNAQNFNSVWRLDLDCWQIIISVGLFHSDNFFFGGFQCSFLFIIVCNCFCLTTVFFNVGCDGRATFVFHGLSSLLSVELIR